MRVDDVAVQGMFLFQGFMEAGKGEDLSDVDMGQIEVAQYLSPWATHISDYLKWLADENWEFPGVYEYEVTEPFGAWLRTEYADHSNEEALETLQSMTAEFLGRGKEEEENGPWNDFM